MSAALPLITRRRAYRRRRLLQALVIPREIPLEPVADVARAVDAVILIRIDDKLSINAETAQRLIPLLASGHGHIEITLAAQKQRRSLDAVGVKEWIGNFLIGLPRLRVPGRADFVVVLNDVLISPVKRDGEGRAGAAGRRLEAIVAGDHVIGQDAAVAPTADAQTIRIGHAHLDDVINARLQVFDFIMTPVGEDRARELLSTTRAAAIVHGQYRVPVRRKELPFQTE